MIRTDTRVAYADVDAAARFGFYHKRLNQAFPLLFASYLPKYQTRDVIYLRNGKKLSVERAWEDGDRIHYERNGNVFGFSKDISGTY